MMPWEIMEQLSFYKFHDVLITISEQVCCHHHTDRQSPVHGAALHEREAGCDGGEELVLCCVVCCAVLRSAVLRRAVLCCVLRRAAPCCAVPCCAVPCCFRLRCEVSLLCGLFIVSVH